MLVIAIIKMSIDVIAFSFWPCVESCGWGWLTRPVEDKMLGRAPCQVIVLLVRDYRRE